jgi:mono/diheme cytochrome c family protein
MRTMRTGFVPVGALVVVALVCLFLTAATAPPSKQVQRGEYLVKAGGCNDCHTPMKMGPSGPESDMTRFLSGHPEALVMPPAPPLPAGPWFGVFSATMTAWSGPWGVSFTANITSDKETGIGKWPESDFVQAIRTGKHMGKGRPILPPMPIPALQNLTDADLKAMFAYLQSIQPIVNHVPEPVPPPDAGGR